jgi:hypothetical protein
MGFSLRCTFFTGRSSIMELILLGIAAMFCAPLLEKEKKPDKPKDSDNCVIVVVIDKEAKAKSKD